VSGDQLDVAGTLESLDIAGFLTGSATFHVSKHTVHVTLPGDSTASDAALTSIELSAIDLHIGTSSVGASIGGDGLTVTMLAPTALSDTRSWLAVTSTNLSASIFVTSLLTATVDQVNVVVNRGTGAAPLNWAAVLGTDTPPAVATVSGSLTQISGRVVDVDLAGFVHGSATQVTLTLRTVSNTTLALTDATLLELAVTGLDVTLGVSGFGVELGGNIAIESLGATGVGDTRKWLAVDGSSLTATLNLSPITASVTGGKLQLNQSSGLSAAGIAAGTIRDWESAVGAAHRFAFTVDGPFAIVSGSLTNLDLAGLVTGSADFSVGKRLVDATTPEGLATGASLLTLSLSNLHLNAGTDAFGITLTGGSVTVASLAAGARRWLGVYATGLGGSLTLGSVASATVSGVTLQTNTATGSTPLDWRNAFAGTPL
jgi:hypothetical protein